MFDLFRNINGIKARSIRLTEEEQIKLMIKISEAPSFSLVEKQFNLLYDSIVFPIWTSLSKKYVPPLTPEDLKDVFQEGWIKLLISRKRYDKKSSVYNWIYIIKRNLILDKIRKFGRSVEKSFEDDKDEDFHNTSENNFVEQEPNADKKIISNETVALIKQTIDNWDNEIERELLRRRIVYNHKYEQIANDMDMPKTTVHKKLKKALKVFKPKIEKILNS